MDFGNIENKSSNFFNVVRMRESSFSQDAQYRPRKSPRKKFKVTRTSASFMIDQLKSVFWYPSGFMSRIRTRQNWRSEFFVKYLCDNGHSYNKECKAILQYDKRHFAPEAPKIYSIGLRSDMRCLSDSNDLSSSRDTIRDFKKHLSIVHKPTIIRKYWIAQSTPTSNLSTEASFKEHTDHQKTIDCTKSTDIIPKYNQIRNNNHNFYHNQLYEHIEKKGSDISGILLNNHVADNHSFISGDFKDTFIGKDHKYGNSCITRDAQIQTSNKKILRRRKMKRRSKPIEKITHSKRYNEPQIVADFCTVRSHSSSRKQHCDEPWLHIRVLENKRAEYINKFTAVNRQIEEITATLRETCCDDENSRNNLENCDEYFSSISDGTKVNTINWNDVESRSTIALKENNDLDNVKRIIGESKSDGCRNVQKILHVDNLNERVSCPKETIAFMRNPDKILNDAFSYNFVRAIKETDYSSNRIFRNKAEAKCNSIKQMSFDLDLAENQNDELQEHSVENECFNKLCLKNNVTTLNNNAKDLPESFVNLEESRYCKKNLEKKIDEVTILEDIKKRIDRDFDDPPTERSENDTDFFTVSQKDSNKDCHDIDVTLATMIKKSKSTPLIVSTNLDSTEHHNSISIDAMSEYSKSSALSKYFSCTQIPSIISLTKNEDETHNSHSNLHSNYYYYDSRSNLNLNNSLLNLDPNFDRSRSSLEYATHYDSFVQYTSPNKFLETADESYNTFKISRSKESFAENKIYEREYSSLEQSKNKKKWRDNKRYMMDSTFETSKSSKHVRSIDSGVFSSSLIELYPAENSFDVGRMKFKKKHCTGKLNESSATVDTGSDSSCTDDTLDRKVNDAVKNLTKNLILCERRARMKLKARNAHYSQHVRACKFSKSFYDTCCDFFNSPQWSSEAERIISMSTPSLLSLSDSEIEDCESRRQRAFY